MFISESTLDRRLSKGVVVVTGRLSKGVVAVTGRLSKGARPPPLPKDFQSREKVSH